MSPKVPGRMERCREENRRRRQKRKGSTPPTTPPHPRTPRGKPATLPPGQLHSPPGTPHTSRNRSQRDPCTKCTHSKRKKPPGLGNHCARGGTRTGFQPPQTKGSPGILPDPARSGRSTKQYGGESVHVVHTPGLWSPTATSLDRSPGGRNPLQMFQSPVIAGWRRNDI
jgi:hypothetical protein